jgi:hypothetical protein
MLSDVPEPVVSTAAPVVLAAAPLADCTPPLAADAPPVRRTLTALSLAPLTAACELPELAPLAASTVPAEPLTPLAPFWTVAWTAPEAAVSLPLSDTVVAWLMVALELVFAPGLGALVVIDVDPVLATWVAALRTPSPCARPVAAVPLSTTWPVKA